MRNVKRRRSMVTNTHIRGLGRYTFAIPLTRDEHMRIEKVLSIVGKKKQWFARKAIIDTLEGFERQLSQEVKA